MSMKPLLKITSQACEMAAWQIRDRAFHTPHASGPVLAKFTAITYR